MVCKNGTWVGVIGNRNLDELNYSPSEVISCGEFVNIASFVLLFFLSVDMTRAHANKASVHAGIRC